MSLIVYIILFLPVLAGFMFYFRRKNRKVFKILRVMMRVVMTLVIIAVSILFFIFPLSDSLINTGGYDIDNVSMRGNKNIELTIQQVNSDQIEIKLSNHERTSFPYTDYFICRKYENGQWKDMAFGRNAAFAKCVYELESEQSITRVIRWEDFYGKKLENGRYQLDWITSSEFEVR